MNQHLTIRQNGPVTKPSQNPMDAYPKWYKYLLGCYPNSQTSTLQTVAMIDTFRGEDEEILYEASREFVATDDRRTSKGERVFSMPIPVELRDVVNLIKSRREAEEQVRAYLIQERRNRLRRQRTAIQEAWYRGRVSDQGLLMMANKLEAAGLLSAAANLRGKVS